MAGQQFADQVHVQWLGEAQVGDAGRQAHALQCLGGLLGLLEPGAERQYRHLLALADDSALADFEPLGGGRHGEAAAVPARVPHRAGPCVMEGHGVDHIGQLDLVGRGHHHEIGKRAEVGEIERPGMGAAIGADQPGAVHCEAHRQILDRDVVDDLVVGALEEGRVDCAERAIALRRESGGKRHAMLLGDADVEGAAGEFSLELVEPGARRHCRGDRHHLVVAPSLGGERSRENGGVGWRAAAGALVLLTRDNVELDHAMIFVGRRFSRSIALALLRHDMDQHWPFFRIADILEHLDQGLDIMTVDRADVIEAKFLEQGAAGHESAGIFLDLARGAVERTRHRPGELLRHPPGHKIFAGADQTGKRIAECAHGRSDRHVIVVEDDDQPVARALGIVHRLIGHSGGHCTVANHRNRAPGAARKFVGDGKAERGRDRGRAVRRAERVIFAFTALGESRQAPAHAKRADAVASAGDDLVRISLVADVPDQGVGGGVEHMVQRNGQLDHAEPGTKVAAGDRDRRDHLGTKLFRQLRKLVLIERADVRGRIYGIEERSGWTVGHRQRTNASRRACRTRS